MERHEGGRMLMSIALLITFIATQASSVASVQSNDAAALRRLTLDRFEANARNDRAFYERLLAPAFMLLDPHGFPPVTKQQYLDAEFPAGRSRRQAGAVSGFEATIDGDTAVVCYEVAEPYPIGGLQRFETRSRRLDTYVRVDREWRLLSMAIAEPPSWPDVVAIDPRLYAEYAGVYELSPETSIVVTHANGHLFAQVTGQGRVELFPENATTFFDRSDSPLARTVFERNAQGQVVAQIYRAQGQRLRARKVR
jgi:hypothetical protein